MTDEIGRAVIAVEVDGSSAEASMAKLDQAAGRFEKGVADKAGRAARALAGIGDGATSSEAAIKRFAASIERQIAGIKFKDPVNLREWEAAFKGIDAAVSGPLLDKLRLLVHETNEQAAASKAAADAVRQQAQAQASQASFLEGLREQSALLGKSAEDVLRYRAAQLGIGAEAAHLILQLQNQRAAQDAAAQTARDEAQAQREAAAAKKAAAAAQDTFVRSLREQIALVGKSDTDRLRFRGQQLGIDQNTLDGLIADLEHAKKAEADLAQATADAARKLKEATAAVQEQRTAFNEAEATRTNFLNGLREEIKLLGMSEAAQRSYRAAQANVAAGGGNEGQQLINQLERLRSARERDAQAAREQAEAERDAAAARKRAASEAEGFIKSLQRNVTLQNEGVGAALRADLQRFAASGAITPEQLEAGKRYIAQLHGTTTATRDARVAANQLRAAYAQLPAQITDVVTSLASGAPAYLVAIQQGGQIKDAFGGIGNAAKALLGLLTPLRLVVGGLGAVLATLFLAYERGVDEIHQFNKALVLSGNAAGATISSLRQASRAVSEFGGTQSKAAEVLTQLAGSGRVAADVMARAAQAAIGLERAGGEAAEKTGQKFVELGRAPLQTLLKLNETENFLTASLYQQVKALEDQGRMTEAARVAQEAYANTTIERVGKIESSLGTLQKAIRGTTDFFKGMWDAALNVGRQETTSEAVKKAEDDLARARKLSRLPAFSSSPEANVEAAERRLAIAKATDRAIQGQAESTAELAASQRTYNDLQKDTEKSLLNQQRLTKDLLKFDTQVAEARKAVSADGLDKFDADAKRQRDFIIATSAATADSVGVAMAKIENLRDAALEATAAAQARTQREVELGLRTQFDAERKVSQLRVADIDTKLKALEEERRQIGRLHEPYEQLARNDNARLALQRERIRLLEEEKQKLVDLEALGDRRQVSPTEAFRNLERGDTLSIPVAAQQSAATLLNTLREQTQEIRESNEALTLEATLIGKSASEMDRELAKLRLRQQLERDILRARIELAAAPAPVRDSVIQQLQENFAEAIKQLDMRPALDLVKDLLDPSRPQAFGAALTDAFRGAGQALAALNNTFQNYAAAQTKLTTAFKSNRTEDGRVKDIKVENALLEEQSRLRVATFAEAAGAAKGFFKENTKGYKALQAAETAFRAFELAQALYNTTRKLFFVQAEAAAVVSAEATKSAAVTSSAATEIAADQATSASSATAGVINQSGGDPYSAFPRMAAMAAIMAALGFATGAFGSKGGGNFATSTQRQSGAATGRVITADQMDRNRGTVFGDDESRSKSIENSLEILRDTAGLHTPLLSAMRSSLENIENSIAGLGNLVIRSVGGGITTGGNLGIRTGVLSVNTGDPLTKALGFDTSGLDKFVLPGLGGVAAKLQALWGKTTQSIIDSGLELSGTLAELMVRQFADVQTTTSSFFGLSKKTSQSTVFGEVEDGITKQFELVFRNIGETLVSTAGALGKDGEALRSAIESFVIDIPRLSLKDLKGEELQEAIAAAIGAAADDLASTVLPGLGDFQQIGEGYFETLVRVASGIETANYELEVLGVTAIDFADIVRKQGDVGAEIVRQSIVAAETLGGNLSSVGAIVQTLGGSADEIAETYTQLVDVRDVLVAIGVEGNEFTVAMIRSAGGLDALQSSAATFFGRFFTEQERIAATAASLGADFEKLGLAMPASRDAFRQLVQSIDTSTEAGQRLFAKLLGLSEAFDDVASAAEDAANRRMDLEIQLLRAQGREMDAVALERQRELDALRALNPALVSIQEEIYRLVDIADVVRGIDSVVTKFLSGDALAEFFGNRINTILSGAGFDQVSLDQLIGLSRDDLVAIFETVGIEGKNAILEALPFWEQLQEVIRDTKIKELIAGIADSADELLSAYNEVLPAADTLVESWKKNKEGIDLITKALDKLAGVKTGTAIEKMIAELDEALQKRDRLRDVLSSNRDTALGILTARGTQEGVDALRKREAELWTEFASTQSPEVAQAITKVTLDRIRLEGTVAEKALQARYDKEYEQALAAYELRQQTVTLEEQARETQMDALRDQIEAAEKLKDLAQELPAFIGGLRAGNLSNLSFTDRLAQQKSLFEDALKTGNDPQGQLTAYLQQAQQMFGGATKLYSDIFVQAIAQYEQAIKDGAAKADPTIAMAQSQLNALEAIAEEAPELQKAVVDTSQAEIDAILGPGGLQERIGAGLTKVETSIGDLKTALEKKVDELKETVSEQETTIKELGAELIKIRESGAATASNTARIADATDLSGGAPPDRRISGRT